MLRKALILIFVLLQAAVFTPTVKAEYESIYHYYMEEGIEAFYKNDFENAIFYFKTAHAIDASRPEPLKYLNLIKREQEGRLHQPDSQAQFPSTESAAIDKRISTTKAPAQLESQVSDSNVMYINSSGEVTSDKSIGVKSVNENSAKKAAEAFTKPFKPTGALSPQTERSLTVIKPDMTTKQFSDKEDFRLTDALWAQHTKLTLEIEIGKSVNFVGKNIARFLMTNENLLTVTRLDKDRINVKASKRGNTIFYLWDDKGRWAFNIHCVYPFENISASGSRSLNEESVKPFELGYTNSWSTFSKGRDLGNMRRESIDFTNWLGLYGETPYGDFDASIDTLMYPNSTEIVGQRIGLTKGRVGPFKDFTLRGYDTFASLSDLTLSGRNFRGFLLNSYAFDHKIFYSFFHGQDQSVSIYSALGNLSRLQSYIEGFKLTLNPYESNNRYSLNVAHGYGTARSKDFEDKVFSLETNQKLRDINLYSELGYDSDHIASNLRGDYTMNNLSMDFNVRDINKGYSTLLGPPMNYGQAGASFNLAYKPAEYRFDTFLDVYRDRIQPNAENPNLLNFDFNSSYSRPIDDTSSWGASLGYVNTPQTLSARQFAQMGTSYSKNIRVGKLRFLSLSVSQSLQWSRYTDSPSSDYDRFGMRAGLRYRLFKYLYYSLNYEYIRVRDVLHDQWSSPTAFETGLNFSSHITDNISFDYNLNYRNEQQSQSNFSFLAGEDSLSNNVSFTYQPLSDVSVYLDSQLRRVWPQSSAATPAYYDLNLMMGLRSAWQLPFHWNPTGIIQGVVYKDYDGNAVQGKDEQGLAGIKVIAGKYETLTNENGEYSLKVSAKKVVVSLDLKTIPQGFVFSTALTHTVVVEHNKTERINFGLTSRSGIYGVAFLDVNGNGKPDRGDKFISNIIIHLDSAEITKTDYSGSYFFENVNPGKHKIRIDVRSIPIAYFPTGKVEIEIDLKEGRTYVNNIPLKKNPAQIK